MKPGKYSYTMAPRKARNGRVIELIYGALRNWNFHSDPIPIFLSMCPVAYAEVRFFGLQRFRNGVRRDFNLHPDTPILIEVYKCR